MSCKVVSSKIVLCVFVRVCETCMQMCMSAYVYVYVFTHVHTFEFMYTCVYISVCESVCVRGFQHCVCGHFETRASLSNLIKADRSKIACY